MLETEKQIRFFQPIELEYQQNFEFKRIKNDNQAENLFSFCLFYPRLLHTFALVPRYRVIGKYVLLITEAFKDIILILKSRQFHVTSDNTQSKRSRTFFVYLSTGIVICICL